MKLRLHGIDRAVVLDGGLTAWRAAGLALFDGIEHWTPAAPETWTLDTDRVISGAALRDEIEAARPVILDARSRNRFDGRAAEPRPGLRRGHMPGATRVPFTGLTRSDGRFAMVDDLRDLFGDAADATPVLTCGSGMTACVLALGLARLGRPALLYDGSWAGWGQGRLGPVLTA